MRAELYRYTKASPKGEGNPCFHTLVGAIHESPLFLLRHGQATNGRPYGTAEEVYIP